tara:strand:- start:680 stop:1708 length:1029 start_codon:yes stop_codon:yes gene_type:complete
MDLKNNQKLERFDLFKLHDPHIDVRPKSWICAGGENLKSKLFELLNEICDTKRVSKSSIMRSIARNLGCCFSNIKRTMYIRKIFSLPIIMELLDLWSTKLNRSEMELIDKKKELQDSIETLKSNSSLARPVKAVKRLSIDIAKICGAHAADGWIDRRIFPDGFYGYYFTLRDGDKRSVIAFRNWIKNEFGIECRINNRYRRCYSIEFLNKIFLRYLHVFFGFPCGKKSDIVQEPNLIKNSNFELRKAFALGVMTFDGAVCKDRVELLMRSRSLRDSIFKIVNLGGIRKIYSTPHPDKLDRWRLYSSRSVKNEEFMNWLDYFEQNTNKYNRLLGIIKRNSYAI